MKLYNKHGFYIVWIRFWCILWFDCSLFVLSFCERFHLMRCQYQYTFLLIMLRHFTDFYDFWGTKNKTEKSTERRRQRHREKVRVIHIKISSSVRFSYLSRVFFRKITVSTQTQTAISSFSRVLIHFLILSFSHTRVCQSVGVGVGLGECVLCRT